MPSLKPDALRKSLSSGKRGGVFFFYGDEEYLKEEATSAVVAAHIDPATRDFNFDQLRGSDVDAEALASVLQTPPMMAEWRIVVVRDVQALAATPRGRAVVEELLERPIPGLVAVLQAQIPEKSTAKFYDRLKKQTASVEFAELSENDLPGWLMARSENDGVKLEPAAARALASAGLSLGQLVRELEKLRDYVGEKRRITVKEVESLVGAVAARQNRWEWFDLVGEARFREARAALPALLEHDYAVRLVLGLGTHFLRLGIGVAGGERALESALPPHQRWLAQRVVRQARKWSDVQIKHALNDLLRADRLLKSTSLGDDQVMQELLLRLEGRAAPHAAHRPKTATA
jgi:DNA polymerase-3 subunit delta